MRAGGSNGEYNERVLRWFVWDYISNESWVGDSIYILNELNNKVAAFRGQFKIKVSKALDELDAKGNSNQKGIHKANIPKLRARRT